MPTHSDRAALIRLAASMPAHSPEKRTLIAALRKQAALMDDMVARADVVAGALTKKKDADRSQALSAITSGIGPFFVEFDSWVETALVRYEVNDLKALREADLSDEDADELKGYDSRMKGYGPLAPRLHTELGAVRDELLSNRVDHGLREAVMAGAAKGLHGMVTKMPSGRSTVVDIGRGGISTPGSMGVDAEDLAQVMMAGGITMPGMIFDARASEATPYEGVKIRGVFKERKKDWAPAGSGIYTIAGAKKGAAKIGQLKGYARVVATNAAVDWKRSVHVALEYILAPAEEGVSADTHALNMGGKLNMEVLLGAGDVDGVAVSRQLILARYYIKKIRKHMERVLKTGTANALWEGVVGMIMKGDDPWKKGGSAFSIDAKKVTAFLERTSEGKDILAENGIEELDPRTVQARWKEAVKYIQKALTGLSDEDLLTSLHLTLDGMVDDVPEYIKTIRQDKDLMETYTSSLRRASENKTVSHKTAMKTITASERSAMIRLAATLPVGSPERRALIAGCEKLPNKAMQDNCEESKKDGVQPGKGKAKAKSDDKKDDGKMPAELLEKFEAKDKKAAKSEQYALTDVRTNDVDKVRIALEDAGYKVRPYQHKFSGHSVEMVEVEGDSAGIAKVMSPWIRKGDAQKVKGNVADHFKGKKATPKTARLMKRQEKVLQKYLDSAGSRAAMDYDSLPSNVRSALERIKDQESLWSDVERWLGDNNNPHLARWAKQELPEALKKNQFTSEDNPNPKGNDKDGDGETNEPSPIKGKKAAMSTKDRKRLDVLQKKEDSDSLSRAENTEYEALVNEYRKTPEYKGKKGALIRLAASMPKGSQERKAILGMIVEA